MSRRVIRIMVLILAVLGAPVFVAPAFTGMAEHDCLSCSITTSGTPCLLQQACAAITSPDQIPISLFSRKTLSLAPTTVLPGVVFPTFHPPTTPSSLL